MLEEKTSLRPGLGAAVYSLRVSVLPYMACLLSVPYCFLIVFVSLFYGYLVSGLLFSNLSNVFCKGFQFGLV